MEKLASGSYIESSGASSHRNEVLNSSGCYEILNTVNGKRYIGQSQNMKKRWTAHRWHLRRGAHHALPLQRAWDKYGEAAFKFLPILTCQKSMLTFYEQQLLDKAKPEYNLCPIAEATRGSKRSPEACAAISKRMQGNTILKGKKLPPEWCAAISAGLTGGKRTPEQCHALSVLHMGVPRSIASREKQSKAMMGQKKSSQHAANISKGKKGKKFPPHTQEHKDKIAATMRATLAAKRAAAC